MLQNQFKSHQSILIVIMYANPNSDGDWLSNSANRITPLKVTSFYNKLLQSMNNLEIEIARPHYINRNEQFDKKQLEKSPKIKNQRKSVPIKNMVAPRVHNSPEEEMLKIKELKDWLLSLLTEAKNNWEQELITKKNMILLMKKDHREKLMKILKYIEQLRKKAYEQYKHVCSKIREDCCTICYQRGMFFNDLVRGYLNQKQDSSHLDIDAHLNHFKPEQKENDRPSKRNESQRSSIELNFKSKIQRESRFSRITDASVESNQSQEDLDNQKHKGKNKIHSKFKKVEKERASHKVSQQKTLDTELNTFLAEQRENGSDYRFSQSTKGDSEAKLQSRFRKSAIPNISQFQSTASEFNGSAKPDESASKRNSRSSLRQSILKQSVRGTYQQGEFYKPQFKLIDAEQAMLKKQSTSSTGRLNKFGIPRNGQLYDQVLERSVRKRKSNKGRNNRYIKKNDPDNNMISLQMTESQDTDSSQQNKRQRDEIQQLLREKQFLKNEHFKKISRYRRERMFYDVIKKEILDGDGLEEVPECDNYQPKETQTLELPQNSDFYGMKESEQSFTSNYGGNHRPKLKKYSLMERKESLISKLALLNQGNTFESIKGKFEEILNQKGNMIAEQSKDEKGAKNFVEKFLSEVLKITDLKRLMKQKFFKESDWSPKMREMHQFYTYLQYSMEAFRSKLNKTAQTGWKDLSSEGKIADSKLDGLILDHQMRDWEGLELSNIGQEHHRQIQCSMKYYGIDVKRLKNLNQISYQVAGNKTLNPIFSSVGQRSMKQIQEKTENIFIF